MKNNIAILCLSDKYSKYLGKTLADNLDMFFADINDILQYNMIDQNMLETAGKEYFDKQKEKVIASVCEFENSAICGSFDIMINYVKELKNNCLLVYLSIKKEMLKEFENKDELSNDLIKNLVFEQEDEICKQSADIVIEITEDKAVNLENIKNSILNYYKVD